MVVVVYRWERPDGGDVEGQGVQIVRGRKQGQRCGLSCCMFVRFAFRPHSVCFDNHLRKLSAHLDAASALVFPFEYTFTTKHRKAVPWNSH